MHTFNWFVLQLSWHIELKQLFKDYAITDEELQVILTEGIIDTSLDKPKSLKN